MQDPLDISFLKQDTEFIKTSHKDLMRSYISLSAEVSSLHGLVLQVASQHGMDTDEILDTLKKKEDQKKKELFTLIKKKHPKFYDDLFDY